MSARPSHDAYYLDFLKLVATRSTCVRRAVGAIIVDAQHRVLSTGFNGVPAGFVHCLDRPCAGANDPKGDTSKCLAVHAELNALLQCARIDLAHTLYVSCTPCKACALAICNTPIQRIVARERYADDTRELFMWKGIQVEVHPEETHL